MNNTWNVREKVNIVILVGSVDQNKANQSHTVCNEHQNLQFCSKE